MPESKRIQVLIVDPSPEVIADARYALSADETQEYEVRGTTDGASACRMIGTESPALVVVGDGLERPASEDIIGAFADGVLDGGPRLAALVGTGNEAGARSLLRAGAEACLEKPLRGAAFRSWVKGLLGLRSRVPAHARMHETRTFVTILASSEAAQSKLKRQIEAAGALAAMALDVEAAIALGRSPLCSALVVVEPLEGIPFAAVAEAAQEYGISAPVMRLGAGDRRHAAQPHARAAESGERTMVLLESLGCVPAGELFGQAT